MNSTTLQDRIRGSLAALKAKKIDAAYTREAAVLMPIFERDKEPYFLLTLRTNEVLTHKGQISFPGGMRHDGETLQATALRETYEEVGIETNKIEVLGQFHEYLSNTGYCVTPFAGYVQEPNSAVPQAREVAEILHVPVRIFLDPKRLRVEQRLRMGKMMDVHFYSYGQHEIWGLTARIIKDFLEQVRLIS